MPLPNPKTQVQNDLDINLRYWREAEMAAVSSSAVALRDTVTSIDDALEEMESYLITFKRLTKEV